MNVYHQTKLPTWHKYRYVSLFAPQFIQQSLSRWCLEAFGMVQCGSSFSLPNEGILCIYSLSIPIS